MPYRFTGYDQRLYTQYRDLGSDRPLTAVPGGTYDMTPVSSLPLPVPPADGLWEPAEEETPASRPLVKAAPLPALAVPPPALAAPPAENDDAGQ